MVEEREGLGWDAPGRLAAKLIHPRRDAVGVWQSKIKNRKLKIPRRSARDAGALRLAEVLEQIGNVLERERVE